MANKRTGWGGVFTIYPLRKLGKGGIFPAVFLLISIAIYSLGDNLEPIALMKKVAEIITNGFPSIIGFVLTGYALIIGFSGTELVGKMACVKFNDGHSYFEVVSSIFAVVLGIVVSTYIVACVVTFVIELQIQWPFELDCARCFNTVSLFGFLFLFYYSIFSLLDIIVNVFNIGQYANAVAQNKQNLEETNKDNFIVKVLKYVFSW